MEIKDYSNYSEIDKQVESQYLYSLGVPVSRVAELVGINYYKALKWCKPNSTPKRINSSNGKSRTTIKSRIKRINNRAKINGYSPCTTPIADIIAAYNQCCHICRLKESSLAKPLVIDHCHVSGNFRGWLCYNCNMGLGLLGDSLESINKAKAYLEKESS